LSLTKLGGFIGTRVRRRRDCHYDQGINRKKGTLFQVGREGDGQSQTQWLGLEVDKFQKAMGQDDE
jgi:hypothetical protein